MKLVAKFKMSLILSQLGLSLILGADWWEAAGGPYGGTVNEVTISNDGRLFASTNGYGIFYSDNKGEHWHPTSLVNLRITTISEISDSTLLAGGWTYSDGSGLYLSTDKGLTWKKIALQNKRIVSIKLIPDEFIYIATSEHGLFRITLPTEKYKPINIGLSNLNLHSITIHKNNTLFAATTEGLYQSIDNGKTWELFGFDGVSVISLFSLSENIIIVSTIQNGLYRSIDNGVTWELVGFEGERFYTFVETSDGRILGGTRNGIYHTESDGETWELLALEQLVVFNIVIDEEMGMYAATSQFGVYHSGDDGFHWNPINIGLNNVPVNSIYIKENGNSYIGTDVSAFFSPKQEDLWEPIGRKYRRVSSLVVTENGTILIGTIGQGLYRSDDGGNNWTKPLEFSNNISGLAISGKNIFAGTFIQAKWTDALYYSSDNGKSWQMTGLRKDINSVDINPYNELVFSHANRGQNHGLYKSSDLGVNWKHIGFDDVMKIVNDYAFLNEQFYYLATRSGVYISEDLSDSWHPTPLDYNTIAIEINKEGQIFAGGDFGVYKSNDNGNTWYSINEGLEDLRVRSLLIGTNGRLYAGTNRGLYRSIDIVTSMYEDKPSIPQEYTLFQNYPNPFNPETVISYTLPEDTQVRITIYDILGRIIEILIDEYVEMGNHNIIFDASHLASGIYFYKMETQNFTEVKRMVFMR